MTTDTKEPLTGRRPASWTRAVKPLFLVGSGRSGTTWLQAMLGGHPEIFTGPETGFFIDFAQAEIAFQRPKERRIGTSAYLTTDAFYQLMAETFWTIVSSLPMTCPNPTYFLEKSPRHGEHGEFILKTFPDVRFIHLIRDGRAVVASLLRTKSWANKKVPPTAAEATAIWQGRVRSARRISDQAMSSDQYIELKYEDLRQSPHEQLSRLFEWLSLPAGEELIADIVESNALNNVKKSTDKFTSIPMPEGRTEVPTERDPYTADFFGSAPVQVADIDLTRLQRAYVERYAGDLLRELGYGDVRTRFNVVERLAMSPRVRRLLRLPPLWMAFALLIPIMILVRDPV